MTIQLQKYFLHKIIEVLLIFTSEKIAWYLQEHQDCHELFLPLFQAKSTYHFSHPHQLQQTLCFENLCNSK